MALNLDKIDLGGFGGGDGLESTVQDSQLNASISEAVKINPDQQAKVSQLSQQSGIPEFAVDDDPGAVEDQLKLDSIDLSGMSKRNPNTAKYLTDFNNAAIAHDDIDVLQEIEDIFDFGKTFENIGDSISASFTSQGAGFAAAGVDMTPSRIRDLVPSSGMPIGMEGEAAFISQELASNLGIDTDEQLQQAKADATEQMLVTLREQQAKRKALTPEDLNLLEQGVRSGVESLANMAPGFGLMLLSGGRAAPLLATIGVQTLGDSYTQGRADGLTPQQAGWFASINAAIEVGTELLPTGTLETIITGKSTGLKKSALKFLVQEMGTEQLATLGQTLNENAFGIDEQMEQAETVEEMVTLQLRRQAVTAIATVVAGGAQITAATGVRKAVEAIASDGTQKETQGEVEQRKLDQLNTAAEQSKLKERSKESFKQFVEQADGDNNTHVFIDGAQTSLYLQTKTRDEIAADPALTLLQEGVNEAAALGGEISVPVAEFTAEIAGTVHFEQLRDSMTMSEATVAPFRQEQVQAETQAYIRTLLDDENENVSQFVEAQEIYTTVRDQLVDSGQVNAANASIMAQIVPAWATAQSRSTGKTVQQVYVDSGLIIEGPLTGEQARLQGEQVLSQEQIDLDFGAAEEAGFQGGTHGEAQQWVAAKQKGLDLSENSRKARAVDQGFDVEEVLYHGTAADFTEFDVDAATGKSFDTGVFLSNNQQVANSYAGKNNGRVIPTYIKAENPLVVLVDPGTNWNDINDENSTVNLPDGESTSLSELFDFPFDESVSTDDVMRNARAAGFDVVTVEGLRDIGGAARGVDLTGVDSSTITAVFDPSKIRSVNAAFDPDAAESADLLAQAPVTPAVQDQEKADDLLSEIEDFSQVDAAGLVTVFHRTSKENAEKIRQSGQMTPKENGLFFSTNRDGQAEGFGDEIIEFKIPADQLELDDLFDAEAHLRIPAKANQPNDVSQFLDRPPAGPLEQPTSTDAPGARGYYDPANSIIRLTESADLSTFLHEFAHFMYEMEVNGGTEMLQSINNWYKRNADDVAAEANRYLTKKGFDEEKQAGTEPGDTVTPEEVNTYLDTMSTGDADKDSAIRRAVHEQFARGFETYLMEGKAPSIELRNAFRTFARWLSQIYQNLRGDLKVDLTVEMRQVFDRLLATEEQIAAAEARQRVEPMFTDAVMAGMTEEEFNDYQQRQSKVKDVQSETLRDKLIKQLTRQQQKWWNEEKRDIADEEIERLKTEKVHVARDQLKTGDLKLDFATVKEMVGEEKINKIGRKSVILPPKLRGMTAKEHQGMHPDEAAAILGYDSGSELLDDLINAPSLTEAADVAAESRMVDRHGDIMTDGTIEKAADEAVQDEERGKLLLHELKIVARGTNAPTVDRATIKAIAAENIGKLSFRQIFPGKYRSAEIKAANEAGRMLAEGNKEGAAAAKMRQVVNYYLGMEATNAKNETTKIVDRMARYSKKKVQTEIMKSDGGHWEQISKILSRFEFRKSATLGEVENINLWMKERNETDGDGLVLTPAVLNESFVTHWKNVPFSDLQGINESVGNIEHVARYANKMTLLNEEIEFKKLKGDWVDHIKTQDERFETKASKSRTADARDATLSEHVRRWASQLTKIPFMMSWLDGGERAGLSHQLTVQKLTDALDAKLNLVDSAATPVNEAILNRSKADQKRHMRKIWIPEIDDHLLGHQVLAVALNTGNQGNLRKLLLGEGWADPETDGDISLQNPQLQAVLKHMTKSDWELVQLIWDQMETLFPQLAEVHRRTTGLAPPKVESTPVETEFGTFKGGYYPVKYSPQRSHKAEKNAEKLQAETESMFNNTASIQASVNTGATNERTGFYDRINLSLDVVSDHFNETIHYITHHDAVRQINKLITAPDVANAITGVLGESEFKQLKPWLNDVAKDGRQQPTKTFIDEAFQRLRFGTTLGVMGFKASTGIMQFFGLFTTAAEIGVGPTVKGIQTAIGRSWYMKSIRRTLGTPDNMQSGWDFAAERSKVMNHRAETMDREIRNAMTRLKGKRGIIAATQEASMKHIALIQTYMVDLPTWLAAYDKTISETGDEKKAIQTADLLVESLQGSGSTKDMAAIVRNQSKLLTTFTMFMTFFSSLGNLSRDLVKGARTGRYSPTSVAAKLMFLYTIPVFMEMLMRGDLDEPEDEDDRMSKYLTGVALYPLASIPFIRDVAGGLIGDFGYNSSPVAAMLERGIAGFKGITSAAVTDKEVTKAQVKNATKLVGAALGVPGVNQMWSTGEHLYDVIEEGEEFTVREALFGPKRD
jgi:hypothetical protein